MLNFENNGWYIAGHGSYGKPFFWIDSGSSDSKDDFIGRARGLHVAFRARSKEEVQQWYDKCLELGRKDNGAPGPRPEYHS